MLFIEGPFRRRLRSSAARAENGLPGGAASVESRQPHSKYRRAPIFLHRLRGLTRTVWPDGPGRWPILCFFEYKVLLYAVLYSKKFLSVPAPDDSPVGCHTQPSGATLLLCPPPDPVTSSPRATASPRPWTPLPSAGQTTPTTGPGCSPALWRRASGPSSRTVSDARQPGRR